MQTEQKVLTGPLGWLVEAVRNDPHRDAPTSPLYDARNLGVARWMREHDRPAWHALDEALSAVGVRVLPWRQATNKAALIAPDPTGPAPVRTVQTVMAGLRAETNDGARSDDPAVLPSPEVLVSPGELELVSAAELEPGEHLRVLVSPAETSPQPSTPVGITVFSGEDAARDAREGQREAERDGAPDPLDGLAERITLAGDPSLALDALAIGAALDVREGDGPAFLSLRRALKGAGVPLTEWTRALDVEAKRRKGDAKEAERAGLARAAQLRREAREAQRVELVARFAAEREGRPDLAAHFNQAESNGATFTMEPGAVMMEAMTNQGIKRTTLANFSAPIVAHTSEFDAPGAKPRSTFTLSVVLAGGEVPREVDIEADRFARMEWVEPALGPRAVVAPGKGSRDNLRAALGYLSAPVTRSRYAFTGWIEHEGRWVYLHAAGAIGAEGVVEGLAATPPAPVDRFALPAPPTGDELVCALDALLQLVSMEPASVTIPMVALAFHAPLGGSRCAVHVNGRADLGKSVRASLVQRLFGAKMNAKAPPASWADGSTAIGIGQVLARAGDALVIIDDLRVSGGSRDEADAAKVDRVLRAHFNGAAPLKGRRDGGGRTDPASRCDLLSTGETLPKGPTASTLNRVVTVTLETGLPASIGALDALASAGVLAAGMAAYLRWLAPQVGDLRPRARGEERAAALRWGFTTGDRASELMGGLCLGLEYLFTFLRASGVDVAHHQLRARAALHDVAGEHGVRVAEEGAAHRFVGLIGQALRSGGAHVIAVKPSDPPGKGLCITTPADPHLWGYQRRGLDLLPQGKAIGYLTHALPCAVCLEPAAALAAVKRVALESGQALGVDRASVGAALYAAGMLARGAVEGARGRGITRMGLPGGPKVDVWALKLDALGFDAGPDTPDAAGPETPDNGTGAAPMSDAVPMSYDTPEFPSDVDPFTL